MMRIIFALIMVSIGTGVSAIAGSTKQESKVVICHIPSDNPANAHNISVSLAAAIAHIADHGDYEGPCNIDSDGDGIQDFLDNCRQDSNTDQTDTDGDGQGDTCDICPVDATGDTDGDGFCDSEDLCLGGNDTLDEDADGLCGDSDSCPNVANPDQADSDFNGVGDACEPVVEPTPEPAP